MSGWDAPSRPAWDEQSGTGENTQSFGMPDYPEESGGFPSSASPGTPPAIFLQDYDQNDVVHDEFGGNEFGGNDFGGNDFGRGDYARGDTRQEGFGSAARGQPDFRRDDLAWDDFAKQDEARRGFAREDGYVHPGRGQRGSAAQDYPAQDYPAQDYPAQDYPAHDYPAHDYPASTGYPAVLRDPLGPPDADHAARMDPALRDFFAPAEARQDYVRPGFGQHGAGQRGYLGQGSGLGPSGGQQANGYRQPARPGEPTPQPSRWDTAGPRQGSRSRRRQEAPSGHRGLAAVIVIAVVIGAAVGGYLVFHHSGSKSPAATPTTSPRARAGTSGTRSNQPARNAAGYTLTVPRTAGGYHALTSIPAALQSSAGTTEVAIAGAALKNGGGKVAGKGVATAYQLSDGQAMTYMGYQGTFNPAKVVANLAQFGSSEHQYSPGTHGGQFTCATAPGTPHGTVCAWVTKTTFAVTEFFSSTGPEVVTTQSKAAADTLKVRDSVEVPKA